MDWRGRQRTPDFQSPADFQAAMGEDNLTQALRLVTRKRSNL